MDGLIKVNENLNVASGGMLVDTQEKFYLEILDDVEENEIKISSKLYEKFSLIICYIPKKSLAIFNYCVIICIKRKA